MKVEEINKVLQASTKHEISAVQLVHGWNYNQTGYSCKITAFFMLGDEETNHSIIGESAEKVLEKFVDYFLNLKVKLKTIQVPV